jgi:hypothetical protein
MDRQMGLGKLKILSYYPQKGWINQGFRRLHTAWGEKSFVKDRKIC